MANTLCKGHCPALGETLDEKRKIATSATGLSIYEHAEGVEHFQNPMLTLGHKDISCKNGA